MKAPPFISAFSLGFKFSFVLSFAFLALSESKATKEGNGRIRPGLLTGPSKDKQAREGESVEFRWRFALSSNDMKQLQQIDFGYCYKTKLNQSLIKIHRIEKNNLTMYNHSVTERFAERLQWLGGSNIVYFILKNITRKDSNSYIMVMSFGKGREPITDHVELIVTYPPKILKKPVTMEQVRFPEGVSVQMSCEVDSCPRAQVTWYHDDRIVQKQKEKHDLTINNGHVTDSGMYRCEARNDLGSDFKQVLVIVTSCHHPNSKEHANEEDKLHEVNSPNTLFTMIAPAVVFFVIFTAYFLFRCPANRNRRKRNRALVNSKATSTPSLQDDEQTTSLLADWSNFNDRGEKV